MEYVMRLLNAIIVTGTAVLTILTLAEKIENQLKKMKTQESS